MVYYVFCRFTAPPLYPTSSTKYPRGVDRPQGFFCLLGLSIACASDLRVRTYFYPAFRCCRICFLSLFSFFLLSMELGIFFISFCWWFCLFCFSVVSRSSAWASRPLFPLSSRPRTGSATAFLFFYFCFTGYIWLGPDRLM